MKSVWSPVAARDYGSERVTLLGIGFVLRDKWVAQLFVGRVGVQVHPGSANVDIYIYAHHVLAEVVWFHQLVGRVGGAVLETVQ